jgi:porphobilinogen synthase
LQDVIYPLNDLVLPIFVERRSMTTKPSKPCFGVICIPEKYLAREIERIANAIHR